MLVWVTVDGITIYFCKKNPLLLLWLNSGIRVTMNGKTNIHVAIIFMNILSLLYLSHTNFLSISLLSQSSHLLYFLSFFLYCFPLCLSSFHQFIHSKRVDFLI
ncbi:hypothetical protein V8G54_013747 [Vigna mungo]|uniref:Uncharacterized protein n=1 Tax=Vigna mungo TaxID=3915 RepID=A0AAQ3NIA1_VIGMU